MRSRRISLLVWVSVLAAMGSAEAWAQAMSLSARPLASHLVVPQRRVFSVDRPQAGAVQITEVDVGVVILERAATTTMEISLRNPSSARQQAELIVPVPDGAVVRGFTYQGAGREPSAQVLPRDEARRTYEAIVAQIRDPALLEFVGCNLIRSSVFPVEARGTQKLRLTYDNLLHAEGDRIDYILPRTESLDYRVPWKVTVSIRSKTPISAVYSPSHKLETRRLARNAVAAQIAAESRTEPGAFRLSCLLQHDGVSASLFAYPDLRAGGGYFLLLMGLPATAPKREHVPSAVAEVIGTAELLGKMSGAPRKAERAPAIKREVTLVLDRSGSMGGEKIDQVREAALQILAGLEEGEPFNIIVYNDQVDFFSPKPVLKTRETVSAARAYLRTVQARGGTNLHDALLEALRQKPLEGALPMVLFLTDGLPTVGQTSEVAIREVAMKANPHERRIFTFGVGVDVNTPLLDKIALETRATSTYVLPNEDVEVKVASVFSRLAGPVLAGPSFELVAPDGKPAPGRVRDVLPCTLPDLFEGDQLVLLGQYLGDEPLDFKVTGNYLGKERSFRFKLAVDNATTKNAFVPRLWASRKIAFLFDAIRQLGANGAPATVKDAAHVDPRVKELVDEIVRISTEFGILTEYTAFLAREGTDLSRRDQVLEQAHRNYVGRAMKTRSGLGAVNQNYNYVRQVGQDGDVRLNFRNDYYDENMNRVTIANVQQVNDLAFYRRNDRWVDSRIVGKENEVKPKRVIGFGSAEFMKLAERLAAEGRQGSIALEGDILLVVDGEPVLVKSPTPAASAAASPAAK